MNLKRSLAGYAVAWVSLFVAILAAIALAPEQERHFFSASDLIDLPALASKPKRQSRAFDRWLAAQLSSGTQAALASYQDRASAPTRLQEALLEDLSTNGPHP